MPLGGSLMNVHDITCYLEQFAPLNLQEDYDNCGLIIGSGEWSVDSILLAVDVTEAVIDDAVLKGAGMIVAHHPLIFNGVKKINGSNRVERCIMKAIENKIAVYAAHTNLDSAKGGVNSAIAEKLGLVDQRILAPKEHYLFKLVTFIPHDHLEPFRSALFQAGAGRIGEYDSCSYSLKGEGTFRGSDNTNPFVGKKGELHTEPETRIETIFPKHLTSRVVKAIHEHHPYEEPAYDIYPLENTYDQAGLGIVGNFKEAMSEAAFLETCKTVFSTGCIRHSPFVKRDIKRVALCGGSGGGFINAAIAAQADAFITGDIKYDVFFQADGKILLLDVGHYESELIGMQRLAEVLNEAFPDFSILLTSVSTNPVRYK